MLIDKNGKLFGKLSIIDFAVILLVIAAAIGVGVRFFGGTARMVKSDKTFEYVVKVEGVRQYTVDALQKKGKLTDKRYEQEIGEITNVDVEDVEFQSTTADGSIVFVGLPERYTCYVTIRSVGKESDNSYFAGDDTEISAGRQFAIYSKYVDTTGTIQSVNVVE